MKPIELKKVFGLELQSNSFKTREGSLEIASNVVLQQDDIISKKRGEKTFYDPSPVIVRNLGQFLGKLLGFCADRVQVYNQNGSGAFTSASDLTGKTVAISEGTKARTAESNGNLYFTTDDAVLKLESITGEVLNAGVAAATDLQVITQTISDSETFFRPDSQIAYRVAFGRKDANNNFVLGAPSQIVTTTNPIVAAASASISTSTVTVNTSGNHGLTIGDAVYISGANGSGVPDGTYTVATTPDGDTFTFTANTGSGVSTLNWGTYKTVTLEFAIPSELDSTEFLYRIYRTSGSLTDDTVPDESTLQLVEERNLTSDEISTGFVVYLDETPDILRGAYLYTNPNTGEARGIAEANEKPPKAADLALFKNHLFFADLESPYTLSLSLIASDSASLPDGSEITFTSDGVTRTYEGALDPAVGNRTVRATSVSNLLEVVTITYNDHGFNDGDTIAVAQALDSLGVQLATLPQGNYTVANAAANTFDITAPATPAGLTTLSFEGISRSGGNRLFYIANASTSTVASAIDATARALVRAINRDASSAATAYYVSAIDAIPGKMLFRSKGTAETFYVNAVTSGIGDSFSPILPSSGETVIATRDDERGVLAFSKPGEPEACPTANRIPVGSKSARILRIKALRDSLIVIKEDGLFRINGDNYSSFVATILDSTVRCKAADSVSVLNNLVHMVADQGICQVSETSATISSRAIEPLLTAVIGKSYFPAQTHAVAYESERLYLLTTVKPVSETADRVYCYNDKTAGFSTWTKVFLDAIIKEDEDKLYFVDLNNTIFQERKNQNRIDYCGDDYATTVLETITETTAKLSIVGATASVGDIFISSDIINRIVGIESDGVELIYEFARPYSFVNGATGLLYKAISSQIRFAPLVAGDKSRMKVFSEFQLGFRNNTSVSRLDLYFISDLTAGSEITSWQALAQGEGWGESAWGQFPWGLEEGTDLIYGTTSSQDLRTYVPLDAARTTFIQADITHAQAAENIMLQSAAYWARIYGNRTTR